VIASTRDVSGIRPRHQSQVRAGVGSFMGSNSCSSG
jgi:hypothetical protein